MYCIKCGKIVPDDSAFCNYCGQSLSIVSNPQAENAVGVGNPQQSNNTPIYNQPNNLSVPQPNYYQQQNQTYYNAPQGNFNGKYNQANTYIKTPISPAQLLKGLSNKVRTEGIIWIVIASLQMLFGSINIVLGLSIMSDNGDGQTYLISGAVVVFAAILNCAIAIDDLIYSKAVLAKPVDIVERYQPVGGLIGALIYNIIIGGIIGIVGVIFGFLTRSYVMNNSQMFNQIEDSYKLANSIKNETII